MQQALALANHPAVRKAVLNVARNVAVSGVRALGKSRARRQKRGAWYFGRRIGIPARRRPGRNQPRISQLATTTTRTVAANVGQAMARMQVPNIRVETGSESLGTVVALADVLTNGFGVIWDAPINPAEPSIFPCLSAIANQYQRFVTRSLSITFTPSLSTTANGQIYMAFVPKADQAAPTSVADFDTFLGTQRGLVYGTATRLNVTSQQLQQAYKVQQVEKVEDMQNDSTPLNCSGRLFIAINGADSTTIDKVIGTLTCTYTYEFSTKQLSQGSNSLHSHYYCAVTNFSNFELSAAHLTHGHHTLEFDDVLDCYRLRSPRGNMVFGHVTHGTSDNPLMVLSGSYDAATWAPITLEENNDTTDHIQSGFGIVPYYPYIKFAGAAHAGHTDVWLATI